MTINAPLAQRIERSPPERKVAGSSPVGSGKEKPLLNQLRGFSFSQETNKSDNGVIGQNAKKKSRKQNYT